MANAVIARIIQEIASHVGLAPSPCPSPLTHCIGKGNRSLGEGIQTCAALPGTGHPTQGVPGEGVSGILELSGLSVLKTGEAFCFLI